MRSPHPGAQRAEKRGHENDDDDGAKLQLLETRCYLDGCIFSELDLRAPRSIELLQCESPCFHDAIMLLACACSLSVI